MSWRKKRTPAAEVRVIPLHEIETHGETQLREAIHWETVAEYAALLEEAVAFPPVRVCQEKAGGVYWIADGWHRVLATAQAGGDEILAEVHAGGMREAIWAGLGANAAHGRRRTNADKRHEVEMALRLWPEKSNRLLAEKARVAEVTVRRVREDLEAGGEIERVVERLGADGVTKRHEPPTAVPLDKWIPDALLQAERQEEGLTWRAVIPEGAEVPTWKVDGEERADRLLIMEAVRAVDGEEGYRAIFEDRPVSEEFSATQRRKRAEEEARREVETQLSLELRRTADYLEREPARFLARAVVIAADHLPPKVRDWVAGRHGLAVEAGHWERAAETLDAGTLAPLLFDLLLAPETYQMGVASARYRELRQWLGVND